VVYTNHHARHVYRGLFTPPIGGLLNDEEYKKRFGDRPRDKSVWDLEEDTAN
jgi:hypothetical protein